MRKTRLRRAFFFFFEDMISSWEASAADASFGGGFSSYGNAVVVGDVTTSMRIYAGVVTRGRRPNHWSDAVCRHQKTPFARNVSHVPPTQNSSDLRRLRRFPFVFLPLAYYFIRLAHAHAPTVRLYITLVRHYCCTIIIGRANGLVSVVMPTRVFLENDESGKTKSKCAIIR